MLPFLNNLSLPSCDNSRGKRCIRVFFPLLLQHRRVCLTNKSVVSPVLPGIWVVECKWTVMKVWLLKSNLFLSQSRIMLLLLQSCGPLRLVRMSMKAATFIPEAFSPASKRICRSSKKPKTRLTSSWLQSLIGLFNILFFVLMKQNILHCDVVHAH